MKRLSLIVMVLVLIAGGVWGYRAQTQTADQTIYRQQTISRGDVSQTISATGTLNPVRVVSVGTQVSGTVKKLNVDFNDKVSQGQILLTLDTDLMQAKLAQSEALLHSAQAKLTLAQANHKRMRELFAQQYISQQELDQSDADLAANVAQYAQVKAQVQSDRINLANTVIRSPVAGVVIDRSVDEGQTVAASFQTPTLIKIAQDLSKMQINASFSEADLGKLSVGQQANFRVDAFPNGQYQGTVRQIRLNPSTQQNVVTYDVVIDVANPELKLLPGMTAYVDIDLEHKENVLLVPNAALRFKPSTKESENKTQTTTSRKPKRERGMATVYVLTADGQLKAIPFKAGISDGKFTEVQSAALKEGMSVIVGDGQTAKQSSKNSAPMRGF